MAISGKFYLILLDILEIDMISFIGEHTCKVDAKGRIMLPSVFKRQLSPDESNRFVVKTDIYEKCLILYPWEEWQRQHKLILEKINHYTREHNQLLREFSKASSEASLDNNNRILIPRRLIELVEIKKEVILIGLFGKIEIWAEELYESSSITGEAYGDLANKILGTSTNLSDENIS